VRILEVGLPGWYRIIPGDTAYSCVGMRRYVFSCKGLLICYTRFATSLYGEYSRVFGALYTQDVGGSSPSSPTKTLKRLTAICRRPPAGRALKPGTKTPPEGTEKRPPQKAEPRAVLADRAKLLVHTCGHADPHTIARHGRGAAVLFRADGQTARADGAQYRAFRVRRRDSRRLPRRDEDAPGREDLHLAQRPCSAFRGGILKTLAPLLFLTARDQVQNRDQGPDSGTDD
jgi:hypothetical protein